LLLVQGQLEQLALDVRLDVRRPVIGFGLVKLGFSRAHRLQQVLHVNGLRGLLGPEGGFRLRDRVLVIVNLLEHALGIQLGDHIALLDLGSTIDQLDEIQRSGTSSALSGDLDRGVVSGGGRAGHHDGPVQ